MTACTEGHLAVMEVRSHSDPSDYNLLSNVTFPFLRMADSSFYALLKLCMGLVSQTLIAHGANVEAQNTDHQTSLILVSQFGDLPVVEVSPFLCSAIFKMP